MDTQESAESLVIWRIGHTQPQITNKILITSKRRSGLTLMNWIGQEALQLCVKDLEGGLGVGVGVG